MPHRLQILPPEAYPDIPVSSLTTRFVASTQNKTRCPVYCATFAPDSRRLLTGDSSGGISVWNPLDFNYMQYLQVLLSLSLAVASRRKEAFVRLLLKQQRMAAPLLELMLAHAQDLVQCST
jgi:WD40 repeat protein